METLELPNNNTNLTGDPDEVLWAKTKANFEELDTKTSNMTRGVFTAGEEGSPVELIYDINIVNYSATGPKNSVFLPIVGDDSLGKEIIVRTSNVPAGYNIRVVGSAETVLVGHADTNITVSPYLIAQNGTCKFTYVGASIWLAEDVQGEKTSINGFKPVNNYNNFLLHAINTTAVAISVVDLNIAYPAASTPIGFSAICPNIGLVYIKTAAATWIALPISDVAGLNSTIGGTTSVTDSYKKLVSLTSANLLGMNASPVTVLSAPGAGKAIRVKSCVAIFDSTVTTYANGGVIYLSYNNTTPITNNVAATFLTAGDKVFGLNPLAAAGGVNMLVDTPVTITNDTAPFITGTGVARLLIEYDVVTTGL